MSMNRKFTRSLVLVTLLGPSLLACSKPPRSYEYFKANQSEAKMVIEECRNDTKSGDECNNAYNAVPRNLIID